MLPSDALAAVAPLVAELERLGVAYYLGGSVVSSAHGVPRSSLDVDIVADLRPGTSRLLWMLSRPPITSTPE